MFLFTDSTKPLVLLLFLAISASVFSESFHRPETISRYTYSIDTTKIDTIARDTTAVNDTIPDLAQQVVMFWVKKNSIGMNFNEVAFVNWNAGGNNSISAMIHGDFERKYVNKLLSWRNTASFRYGLNAQEGREVRKSEDQLLLSSTAGYRRDSTSNFRYSAKFNFNTQFANGYRYPDTENPLSTFMAPGYIFLGIGTEFSHPKEDLTVYLSPLTQKSTIVLDRQMANEGRFGVTPAVLDEAGNVLIEGERIRTELGILLTSGFSTEIFTNININNQLSLYTDYLNKFGNIDVDWELNVNMTVNNFVKASFGSHLRYDDDVKVKEDLNGDGNLESIGPRIQFKQMLGVGVVYEF